MSSAVQKQIFHYVFMYSHFLTHLTEFSSKFNSNLQFVLKPYKEKCYILFKGPYFNEITDFI